MNGSAGREASNPPLPMTAEPGSPWRLKGNYKQPTRRRNFVLKKANWYRTGTFKAKVGEIAKNRRI
jgi:hypothetical protein